MRYGGSLRVGQPRRAHEVPGRFPGLRLRWLGRCASACGVGQLVAQLHAGADAEMPDITEIRRARAIPSLTNATDVRPLSGPNVALPRGWRGRCPA